VERVAKPAKGAGFCIFMDRKEVLYRLSLLSMIYYYCDVKRGESKGAKK